MPERIKRSGVKVSIDQKKQFEVEIDDFIVVTPNEMFVVVPSLGGTYAPTEQNIVESSFSVAP